MKLDDVKKLHQKKYREQLGYYLVEGEHLILELQKAQLKKTLPRKDSAKEITLYVTEDYKDWAHKLEATFNISTVTEKQMAQLSDTKTPQGVIACVPLPHLTARQGLSKKILNEKGKRYIYLHEIQDPGNLGTIIRTLAWFGNFRLLLSANSVDPFNSKVVRASMGGIFHVPIEQEVSLQQLQKRFNTFAYLDMQGSSITATKFADYDCYLFGNEARGVPLDALSGCKADAFTIAGSGSIDSLNVASAVNICVYQLSIKA